MTLRIRILVVLSSILSVAGCKNRNAESESLAQISGDHSFEGNCQLTGLSIKWQTTVRPVSGVVPGKSIPYVEISGDTGSGKTFELSGFAHFYKIADGSGSYALVGARNATWNLSVSEEKKASLVVFRDDISAQGLEVRRVFSDCMRS